MKYFIFTEPYYALIKAKNEETAKQIYADIVCEISEDCTRVSRKQAFSEYLRAVKHNKTISNYVALIYWIFSRNDLLIVDTALI